MIKNTSRGREFELPDLELKDFSCEGLLVKSEGTEEFVRFR